METSTSMPSSINMLSPSGPSAQEVNASAGLPKSKFEFDARGGLANTVQQGVQQYASRDAMQKQLTKKLQEGQSFVDEFKKQAVQLCGQQILDQIPPLGLFKDVKSGQLDTLEWAKHSLIPIHEYLQKKQTSDTNMKAAEAFPNTPQANLMNATGGNSTPDVTEMGKQEQQSNIENQKIRQKQQESQQKAQAKNAKDLSIGSPLPKASSKNGARTIIKPETYSDLADAVIAGRIGYTLAAERSSKFAGGTGQMQLTEDILQKDKMFDFNKSQASATAKKNAISNEAKFQAVKVDAANSLMALLPGKLADGTYDESHLTAPMSTEAASAAARLISPSGQQSETIINQLRQGTAQEAWSRFMGYFGVQAAGTTQQNLINLENLVKREGKLALVARDTYLRGDVMPLSTETGGIGLPTGGGQGPQHNPAPPQSLGVGATKIINGVTLVKGANGKWLPQQ